MGTISNPCAELKEFSDDDANVLVHLRDHPINHVSFIVPVSALPYSAFRGYLTVLTPILCAAGKDRTGFFSAAILKDIIKDYALTSVGLQPVCGFLAQRFQKEGVFRNNWKGALSLGTAKPECIRDALNVIERSLGGSMRTSSSVLRHRGRTTLSGFGKNWLVAASAQAP
ncbi:hypothetical protein GSI_09608 [Ganoderma sinense ZZ0214-1]|uniref:Tyrosine specific protein phosphatases domain-containing protein n=1 Tax=Ganoderma sinense ZZ0214-1 TaxID=1077348 RepID=A0A2G8S3H1_9APHY|nr:hypothetical protein GSI_09608 [Ganoderma sinense ZZ0214-1]